MTRLRGGYLGFNRITSASTINSAAGGIWTLREAEALNRAGTWPKPFLPNVLLRFNNNFIDGGINNLTVDAVNGASISSVQSKFGGYSLFLNGNQYARITNANSLIVGANDFTIECFIFCTNVAIGSNTIFTHRTSDNSSSGIYWYIRSNGSLGCFISNAAGNDWSVIDRNLGLTVTPNTWHHIALVRSTNIIKAYLNGIGGNTINIGSDFIGASGPFNIGEGSDRANYPQIYGDQSFYGYIDEFRVLIGLALYTSNFTPPTIPF